MYFYPRSPCGERLYPCHKSTAKAIFLSTLSLRRATAVTTVVVGPSRDFYPRSPCGERPSTTIIIISIVLFLSTLSLRRATERFLNYFNARLISIHALLAESDMTRLLMNWTLWTFLSTLSLRRATPNAHDKRFSRIHFYPRSPCGERHNYSKRVASIKEFLSTLSLRRAT